MLIFDKVEIRNNISIDFIFDLLQEWGGEPIYADTGLISTTICHNPPGEGSRKLYYYENSGLFRCYTGCENATFDIFDLAIKVFDIQFNKVIDLNDSVRYIASRLGFLGRVEIIDNEEKLEDWSVLANYDRVQSIELMDKPSATLKEYDKDILNNFNYSLKIRPWLNEGISQQVIDFAKIGFYPGGDAITIPHFDINDRFIGLRGRVLGEEEGEMYGKYRPLKIN